MDPQRWARVRARFDELVELDPVARAARLKQIADPQLREAVESLLIADAESDQRIGDLDPPFRLVSKESDLSAAPSDPLSLTGRSLAHFQVVGLLDAGGMGVVYRAHDTRLHRTIALKLLLPQFHLDSSAKTRFRQEARSAAALDHPNICTVYEVGESEEGLLFLAMALYPGETLRTCLARTGPQPVDKALGIARLIARGLACAHEAGIVHRDLKPGNVMLLPDGTVKILDFGLAKPREHSLDEAGLSLGTVAYMAPEQIRAEETGERTDLWALGVVLYEMLTGRRPFCGEDERSIAHAIVNEDPVRPRELDREIPPAVEAVVLTLLQKNPVQRPSAAELLGELDGIERERGRARGPSRGRVMEWRPGVRRKPTIVRLLVGGWILAAAAAGLIMRTMAIGDAMEVPLARSVAVLPFTSQSATREGNEYLASGLQDEILVLLGKLGDLKVISRTSVERYANTEMSIRQIGQELGAGAIVEGSVQRFGDRIRVSVRLIDARSDDQMWTETYDRNADDLFAIEREIAQSIASRLHAELTAAERADLTQDPTRNREAYDLYLRGRQFQRRSDLGRDHRSAERLYRSALALDPGFALAHAQLSRVHAALFWFRDDPTEARRDSMYAHAATALMLQPGLAEAHQAMGIYWYYGRYDYREALEELEKARSAHPSDAEVLSTIAAIHRRRGRWEEALAGYQEAAKLDRFGPSVFQLGLTYAAMRRYADAARTYDRVIQFSPDDYGVQLRKGALFLQWKGISDSLAAALQRVPLDWGDVNGEATYYRVMLARLRRQPDDALAALEATQHEVLRPGRNRYIPTALLRAQVYEELLRDSSRAREEYAAALALLERLREERENDPRRFIEDPRLHIALGEVYAGLGQNAEAKRQARYAERVAPVARDSLDAPVFVAGAARIFTRVGDKDEALRRLEVLLRFPGGDAWITPHGLNLDPSWEPLRSDPRFQRMLREAPAMTAPRGARTAVRGNE